MSPGAGATSTDQVVDRIEDSQSDDRTELDPLFVEELAATFRFDTLSKRLLGPFEIGNPEKYSPYLFFFTVFIIDVPILSTIQYLRTGFHPLIANPVVIIAPIAYIYGIWAVRRIRGKYKEDILGTPLLEEDNNITDPSFNQSLSFFERALFWLYDAIGDEAASMNVEKRFGTIASRRFKIGLLFGGWGLHAAWVLFTPGATEFIFQTEGPIIGSIKYFVIIPLVYYPIGVDFAGTYLGVLVFLPLKFRRRGPVDFEDPLGYGGLKPVGNIISSATLLFLIAFTAYAVFSAVGPTLGDSPRAVGTVTYAYIAIGVLAGVGLFVFATLSLHRLMKSAKHWRIERIAEQVREKGPDNDRAMFPDTAVPESADDVSPYIQLHIHMMKVDNMREYPVNISNIQDIIFAALLPYITSLTWNFILQYLG